MQAPEDTTRQPDSRQSFLETLGGRIVAIEENWQSLCNSWRQDGLQDLYTRICELGAQSSDYELHQLHESLFSIEVYLSSFVDSHQTPSAEQQEAISALIRNLRATAEHPAPEAGSEPAVASEPAAAAIAPTPADMPDEASMAQSSAIAAEQPGLDVLTLLSSHSPAAPLVRTLADKGQSLQEVDDTGDLVNAIDARRPRLIVADQERLAEIESIQPTLDEARNRQAIKPSLVFISDDNDLQTRVRALRMGGDAFFVTPLDLQEVTRRVMELSSPCRNESCRIMVVEDDIAQAEFAASILRKAQMKVLTVSDPMQVIEQLREFRPDLILMDIYLPEINGIELTAIIRDEREFVTTPIVFLSGEQSSDKQIDALSVGGDDFLTKPIRPKHLLRVINHRIHRLKTLSTAIGGQGSKQPDGLLDKNTFAARISRLLPQQQHTDQAYALLHLIPDQLEALREQHGLGAVDSLMEQLLTIVSAHIGPHDLLCRLDDHSITALARQQDQEALLGLAEALRSAVTQAHLTLNGDSAGISVSIGHCPLQGEEDEAPSLLKRARRSAVQAQELGGDQVKSYEAPPEIAEIPRGPDLGVALAEDAFTVLYQPLLDLQARGKHNYEIIQQLADDEGDLLTPRHLREMAARSGMLGELDRWLLEHTLEVLQKEATPERPLRLFVPLNVIADDALLDWLKEQIENRGIAAEDMVLEYPLATVSKEIETARKMASRLYKMGVGLSLSRFSEKPAAFKVQKLLRAGYIRVATRLLKADREIISHIIHEAHEQSAQVIVSNVDDPRSIDLHWSSGADYLQGDFIQQPLETMDYDFSQVVI